MPEYFSASRQPDLKLIALWVIFRAKENEDNIRLIVVVFSDNA